MTEHIQTFVFFWSVVDPIGSIPVFLAVTTLHPANETRMLAIKAVIVAACVLLFFIFAGQFLLDAMGVPLAAFQVSGGLIMFAFAYTMIFGESKPEEELRIVRSGNETAIFPLAVPTIAGPGAMMAVVVMTDKHRFDIVEQAATTGILLVVLAAQLVLLLCALPIHRVIGTAGASVVSRVMGIIIASVAVNGVLMGIKQFFNL